MSSFDNKFDYLKLPLVDIRNATSNFSDENIIGRGGFGKIYRGQLLTSGNGNNNNLIDIVARRLDRKFGQGEKEFQTEKMMLSSLKHPNIVSIVGFCDENYEKIIVNKFEANGSLDRYLSDPVTLTWTQRLRICLDIARALSYIHYDKQRSFSVIHRDVKSSKILLGDMWEPKLAGFGLSTMQEAARRHHIVLDGAVGTTGYVDPAYFASATVTHKSDVYSFGVVLFEVLTGRTAFTDHNIGVLFAKLAKSHYENGNLNDIIHPDLQKQMDQGSLKKFSDAAYRCLNELRSQRPHIDQLIFALDQALKLQLAHEDSLALKEHPTIAVEGTSSSYWKGLFVSPLNDTIQTWISESARFRPFVSFKTGLNGNIDNNNPPHPQPSNQPTSFQFGAACQSVFLIYYPSHPQPEMTHKEMTQKRVGSVGVTRLLTKRHSDCLFRCP